MSEPRMPSDPIGALSDPATSAEVLRLIAYYHPELRQRVIFHPNTYKDLVDWLDNLGDPTLSAVIAEHRRGSSVKRESPAETAENEPAVIRSAEDAGIWEATAAHDRADNAEQDVKEASVMTDEGRDETLPADDVEPVHAARAEKAAGEADPTDTPGAPGAIEPSERDNAPARSDRTLTYINAVPGMSGDSAPNAPVTGKDEDRGPEEPDLVVLPEMMASVQESANKVEAPAFIDFVPGLVPVEDTVSPSQIEEQIADPVFESDDRPLTPSPAFDEDVDTEMPVEAVEASEPSCVDETESVPALVDEAEPVPASGDIAREETEATSVLAPLPEKVVGEPARQVVRNSVFPTAAFTPKPVPFETALPMDAPAVAAAAPFQPLAAQRSTVDPQGPAPRVGEGANRGLLVALIILTLVLLGVSAWIFTNGFGTQNADSSEAERQASLAVQSTPTQSEPAASEPQSQPQSTSQPDKYPAPESARALKSFASPSGNIHCVLSEDSVMCQIYETYWEGTQYDACGRKGGVLVANNKEAKNVCDISDSGPVKDTLGYGTFAVNGDSACQSTEDGVSCWNTKSGTSFALSRAGWMTGKTGLITPQNYTF